jgi:hypothetical protein
MVLAFGRTDTGLPLRFTAVTVEGSTPLAAGSLLLRLGGRRQEQFGWDEAALAADGSGVEARVQRSGFDIRTTVTPAPDTQGFDIETVLTAHAEVRVVSLPEPSGEGLALYHAPYGISTSGDSFSATVGTLFSYVIALARNYN